MKQKCYFLAVVYLTLFTSATFAQDSVKKFSLKSLKCDSGPSLSFEVKKNSKDENFEFIVYGARGVVVGVVENLRCFFSSKNKMLFLCEGVFNKFAPRVTMNEITYSSIDADTKEAKVSSYYKLNFTNDDQTQIIGPFILDSVMITDENKCTIVE